MTTESTAATPGRQLARLPEVLRKVPISRSTLYEMEVRGEFPRRIKIGRAAVAWDLREVDEWIASRARSGTVLE